MLLVTSEMNAGLTQVLEAIVGEAKELVPAGRRLTVLFDRGGWSVKLFARLIALGVDIITYRKGSKQTLPRSWFVAHRVREEDQEKTWWLYEQARVRVGRLRPHRRRRAGAGPEYLWLRQVTVLRDDGRQTVIVTNRTDLGAVEVVDTFVPALAARELFQIHGGGVRVGCLGGVRRGRGVGRGQSPQSRTQAGIQGTPARPGGSDAVAGAVGCRGE